MFALSGQGSVLRYCAFAVVSAVLVIAHATAAWPLTVKAVVSSRQVRVGETVEVSVVGTRSRNGSDPAFAGAGIQIAPRVNDSAHVFWKRGGQAAQSPQVKGELVLKTWRFELIAARAGTTSVTPVVYLGASPTLATRVDSVLGAPVTVVILPRPRPSRRPWVAVLAVLAIAAMIAVRRLMRRRREQSYLRPDLPPLAEALDMLAGIRANRREDRARRYLGDIENVVRGYLTRRLGVPLTGKTPIEIAADVSRHLPDSEQADRLRDLLQRCAALKFNRTRVTFDTLLDLEEKARDVLEQIDGTWV